MGKKIAILQSNYIPWKGYFDLIAAVDEFVLYDDVQFTRKDWRNRNQIKTSDGLLWLTVPVQVKGRYEQSIRETRINGTDWIGKHLKSLEHAYRKAPHYDEIMALLRPIYAKHYEHLSPLNRALLQAISDYLGIATRITDSSDYELVEERSERLAGIAAQAGASIYVSGPAAKTYLDESVFTQRDIAVQWFDYGHYPEYPQLWGDFEHHVSIVDLLFNCGKNALNFMKLGSHGKS